MIYLVCLNKRNIYVYMYIPIGEDPNMVRYPLGEKYRILVDKAIGGAIAWDCSFLPTFVKPCDVQFSKL